MQSSLEWQIVECIIWGCWYDVSVSKIHSVSKNTFLRLHIKVVCSSYCLYYCLYYARWNKDLNLNKPTIPLLRKATSSLSRIKSIQGFKKCFSLTTTPHLCQHHVDENYTMTLSVSPSLPSPCSPCDWEVKTLLAIVGIMGLTTTGVQRAVCSDKTARGEKQAG